jgi:3',5'-cyclic AMP phosphodiesterase CpdA
MLRILHLSDLHFGQLLAVQRKPKKSPSAHQFVRGNDPFPDDLANILIRDMGEKPAVVIVSGDVGWSGAKDDYTYALQFFTRLRQEWSDVPFVVAPGNHDVDQALPGARQDEFIAFLKGLHSADFPQIYPLFNVGAIDRQKLVAFNHVAPTGSRDELFVVAVNSAAHLEDSGTPIYIKPDVLQAIEDHLQKLAVSPRTLRIFVLHHHLLPFAENSTIGAVDPNDVKDKPDPTLVWNSAKLQDWLALNSFHVVLHGHKHLSHGREDVLWRRGGSSQHGQRIFVIGAGSAGVEAEHREPGEPLSYNLLSIARLSEERWNVDVSVRFVEERKAITKAAPLYTYEASVGKASTGAPRIFQAERMDDCHSAIQRVCDGKGLITNFMSIVESPVYEHPSTVRIGKDVIDEGRIKSSFLLLHPEYEGTSEWTDISKVDDALQKIKPRFRFSHGQRLFGHPERKSIPRQESDLWETRPILRAVKSLESDSLSKAYVGLYNPEIDAISRDEPLPGLMSIQFIKEPPYLDVVATFRKIDLSFWWVVNMYEIGKLLHWAANVPNKKKLSPRRITFFAALAEWSKDPEPAVVAALDAMELGELAALAQEIHNGKTSIASRTKLKALLFEKKNHTSDTNLDPEGLSSVAQLIEGLRPKPIKFGPNAVPADLSKKLATAEGHIREAIKAGRIERAADVASAKKALEDAIALLG